MTREQIETLIVDNITTNYNGEITAVKVKNILDAIVSDYRHLSDPIALSEVTNLVSSLAGKQATLTETNLKTIVDSLVEMTTITTADKVMATHNAGTTAKWFSIATLRAFFKTYFDEIYQAGLISGTNIKTIDSTSILGAGNIDTKTPRVQSVTSSATVTPTFSNDIVIITAQAEALTIANPTGTAVNNQALLIRIKDNGTARSISFGSQYRAIGVTLPTTTTISKTLYLGMIYNSTDTKWDVLGINLEA